MTGRLLAVAPFLVALAVYLGVVALAPPPVLGDQPHYALEAFSLADDGDRDLGNDYASPERLERAWGEPVLPPHAYRYVDGGPFVSYHAPGLPVLLAPAALLGGKVLWLKATMALMGALAAQLLFGIMARAVPGRRRLRWAVWASVVFSLPLLGFATALYPEVPAALCVLIAIRLLLSARLGTPAIVGAAAAAAFLPWLHVRFSVIAIGLGAVLVARVVGQRRAEGAASVAAGVGLAAVPFAVSLVAMAIAFSAWYGSPSPAASLYVPVADVGPAAVAEPWISGARVYLGLARSLFGAKSGWLPFAPVGLLGVAYLLVLAVRRTWWALAALAIGLVYLVQVASTGTLPGATPPARFELVVVPLVAVPLLMACARVRWARLAFAALAAATVLIAVVGIGRPWDLFPTADPAERPPLPVAGALLAAWPTVTRDPAPVPAQVRVTGGRLRSEIGEPENGALTAPAGDQGLLAATRPIELQPREYGVQVTLRAEGAASADTAVAELAVVVDGRPAAHEAVTAERLPPDGRRRRLDLDFDVTAPLAARVEVRSTGATALAVSEVVVSARTLPITGVGTTGTRYPDVGWVVAWGLVVALVAVALALTDGARGPRRSGARGASAPARSTPAAGAGGG